MLSSDGVDFAVQSPEFVVARRHDFRFQQPSVSAEPKVIRIDELHEEEVGVDYLVSEVGVEDPGDRYRRPLRDQPHRLKLAAHHPHFTGKHGDVRGWGDLEDHLFTVAQTDAVDDVEPALRDFFGETIAVGDLARAKGASDQRAQNTVGLTILCVAFHLVFSPPLSLIGRQGAKRFPLAAADCRVSRLTEKARAKPFGLTREPQKG